MIEVSIKLDAIAYFSVPLLLEGLAHEVGCLGNDDQTTAGNTPPEHLSAQNSMPPGMFATHDEGGEPHAAQCGAGDRGWPWCGQLEPDRPRVVQDHLAERLRLPVEGTSASNMARTDSVG
jgi:hypothetical protein